MSQRIEATPEEKEALGLIVKMSRSLYAIESKTLNRLADVNLTVSQFAVLESLYHLGPMCQKKLATKILKSTGNMTTVIDNLEKRELVERRRSTEDRRYIDVLITDKGAQLIEAFFPGHMKRLVEAFSVLTADERKELSRITRKLGLAQG